MRKSLVIAALVAVAAAPAFARSLQVVVIGTRPHMVPFAINDAGQVVGDNQINGITTAVIWDAASGDAQVLPGAAGISQAGDVTDPGDVIGWYESPSGDATAVIWHAADGYTTPEELGLPSSIYLDSAGFRMNASGEAAVFADVQPYVIQDQGTQGFGTDLYRWTPGKGFTALPNIAGSRTSTIGDIDETGTIVGSSTTLAGADVAVMWNKNDKLTVIGMPDGATSARARGINALGQVVGQDTRNRDSWVWSKKAGFRMLPDFGFNAEALDINDNGIVLGNVDVYPYETTAVVWDADGTMYNLGDLLADRYYIDGAWAINNNNDVVIDGYDYATGDRDAIVVHLTFTD